MALSKIGTNQLDSTATPTFAELDVDNVKVNGNTISSTDTNGDITLDPNGTGDTIIASGNVGINNASPSQKLHVHGAAELNAHDNTSGSGGYNASGLLIGNAYDAGKGSSVTDDRNSIIWNERGLDIDFATSNTYRMKLDYNGNMLVGTTNAAPRNLSSGTGIRFGNDGSIEAAKEGAAGRFNRTGSDGVVIQIRRDGTTKGQMGIKSTFPFIGEGGTGLLFEHGSSVIEPFNVGTLSARDDAVDLGGASVRFDDIRATNGTIQTSDQNDKQQIASLTSTEIAAAKAISALFKTYKWNKSVTANGDAARTHTGVVAQEVQAAMSAVGLDATKYAFWCSDTWWETSTDVPAVEADEEAGIEAKDAYTRIDIYKTSEEAPDGATQRTRMGIRYPELLAFVGAATEQRLGDIETRLATLESG